GSRSVSERPIHPREVQMQRLRQNWHVKHDRSVNICPTSQPLPSLCRNPSEAGQSQCVQAANSLALSAFDRECLKYLQNSTLVILLGKHWPWSTIAYAYKKIAVTEPMVMSMMLASTAREIHRLRLYDRGELTVPSAASHEAIDLDGRTHYGRALSSLREALRSDVRSPRKIEAIFITLWLMVDYENRFGSGESAIDIHIKGIESLLFNHVVPGLQEEAGRPREYARSLSSAPCIEPGRDSGIWSPSTAGSSPFIGRDNEEDTNQGLSTMSSAPCTPIGLGQTSVPLFLLWTLYFFTPSPFSRGPLTGKLDSAIFQFFLHNNDHRKVPLPLPELYRISRQSPARFWGESYSTAARIDDLENLVPLTLFHKSHILQFRITEQHKQGIPTHPSLDEVSPYQLLIDKINSLALESDTVLATVNTSDSADLLTGRRMMETSYWAAITFYSTIIFYHLCFQDIVTKHPAAQLPCTATALMSLAEAVSRVLDLSLKLHRSRPHLVVRIAWPLFLAGVATPDQIYQDWVSIRLRELGRFGQNYARISMRFDGIVKGGKSCFSEVDLYLGHVLEE
ncbi:hypothetical protein N7539_004224, partial [Penicillium diatomitis]